MKTLSAVASLDAPLPAPAAVPEAFVFRPFRVLTGVDLLFRGDTVVPLEPRAVCVLRHLVRHAGRVVGKDELLDEVWPDTYVTDGVLKKAVSQIRRALDDPPQQSRFIETWHRRGYRFIASVERAAVTAPPVPRLVQTHERDLDFDQLAGRDLEMEALRAEYRRALARQATPLLVVGEAGIGKTQLARHFEAWAGRQRAVCLYARFFDYGGSRAAPAAVFLDLLRTALAPDCPGELQRVVEARLGISLPGELFDAGRGFTPAEPLAVSCDEAAALSSQTAAGLASCFIALSRQTPLVLQLDDLQWADPFALDVAACLLRATRGEQLLLVAFARPQAPGEPLAGWRRAQAAFRGLCEIPLRGLTEEGLQQALASILGNPEGEPEIAEEDLHRLHRLTEGNPLLPDRGAARPRHGRSHPPRSRGALALWPPPLPASAGDPRHRGPRVPPVPRSRGAGDSGAGRGPGRRDPRPPARPGGRPHRRRAGAAPGARAAGRGGDHGPALPRRGLPLPPHHRPAGAL